MFYIILCKNKLPGSVALRMAMWSRYSHSAIYDSERGIVYDTTWLQGGVKKHTKEEFDDHYPSQDLRPCPVPAEKVEEARKWLEDQLNKKYDWTALVGFLFRRNWSEDDSWFCSEMSEAFRTLFSGARFVLELWRITPHHQYMVSR